VSSKIFIDTVYVIALINRHDAHHKVAYDLAERYETHSLLTTDAVLLEIGNALARRFKNEAIEIIDEFLTSNNVEIIHLTSQLFNRAFAFYRQRQDKEWGLIDCASFVVMKENQIDTALTFDQHFVQAGFKALMRTPQV
jgi:uncharacterized protein